MKLLIILSSILIAINCQETDSTWKNYLDYCTHSSEPNIYSSGLSNDDVGIQEFNEFYLGKFICITVNNPYRYEDIKISFDGPARLRKIDSTICRKYPDNSAFEENFTVGQERHIKIAIYSPWAHSHRTEVIRTQKIVSIKLNGVEIIEANKKPAPHRTTTPPPRRTTTSTTTPTPYYPSWTESSSTTQTPRPQYTKPTRQTQPPVRPSSPPPPPIFVETRPPPPSRRPPPPSSRPTASVTERILRECDNEFRQIDSYICTSGDFYITNAFRSEITNRLIWCVFQMSDAPGQFDIKLSNDNYELVQSFNNKLQWSDTRYYKLNVDQYQNERYPAKLAIVQRDLHLDPPLITEIRHKFKRICKTPLLPEMPICGHRHPKGVNADENVIPGEYPWQVSIYDKFELKFLCGGTIINKNTILTSGRCVRNANLTSNPSNYRVYFNQYNLVNRRDSNFRDVNDVIVHHDFYPEYHEFDLAVLKLNNEINPELYFPICLTNNKFYMDNAHCVISGFGVDTYDTKQDKLKQAGVIRLPNDQCRRRNNNYRIYLTETTFCGEYELGTEICPENDGSALYCRVDNEWILSGIVTMGVGTTGRCSILDFILFTDITPLYDWVYENSRRQ